MKGRVVRVFVDTEFTDFLECELISIGLVSEDGQEFYAELSDFDRSKCSDFVRAAVLPQLGIHAAVVGTEEEVVPALCAWLRNFKSTVLVCSDQMVDWELLCYLVRDPVTLQLPPGLSWESIANDLDPTAVWRYFEGSGHRPHHALHDAHALSAGYRAAARN
jgi:hypothetical protein